MPEYSAKRIEDMQASFGGGFVKARAELGISSFGVQVIRMPPNADQYPEHAHEEDGQEELYAVLSGSGYMDIEGERVDLDSGTLVRVSSGTKRKAYAGPEGLTMLVVGGVPGEAYAVSALTELE
ncbi:MAG TPA: cupin domain-containing protein [Solirubrobacteraceae bacterium]|nr:cupin domain-containing protein [Solirubrobacteraceae bacterium]